MPRVAQEFEEYARDCVRLAGQPNIPPDVRDQLLHMAREWMQADRGRRDGLCATFVFWLISYSSVIRTISAIS
jgi:hypothetical protein